MGDPIDDRRPLLDDFALMLRQVLNDDPAIATWELVTASFDPQSGTMLPAAIGLPAGRREHPEYTYPRREIVAELFARTTALKSERWDVATQTSGQIPDDWKVALRHRWGTWFNCEMSVGRGWADLIGAAAAWISETDSDFRGFDLIKEKYGVLRAYHLGGSEMTDDIIEAAEYCSEAICDICGAPGRWRETRWYATRCDDHVNLRGSAVR